MVSGCKINDIINGSYIWQKSGFANAYSIDSTHLFVGNMITPECYEANTVSFFHLGVFFVIPYSICNPIFERENWYGNKTLVLTVAQSSLLCQVLKTMFYTLQTITFYMHFLSVQVCANVLKNILHIFS